MEGGRRGEDSFSKRFREEKRAKGYSCTTKSGYEERSWDRYKAA